VVFVLVLVVTVLVLDAVFPVVLMAVLVVDRVVVVVTGLESAQVRFAPNNVANPQRANQCFMLF
jgi:hypothetical protein